MDKKANQDLPERSDSPLIKVTVFSPKHAITEIFGSFAA